MPYTYGFVTCGGAECIKEEMLTSTGAGDGVQLWSGLAAPLVPLGNALKKYELFFNTGEEKTKWRNVVNH